MEPIIRSDSEITLLVDETIYARIALLKTCYWFTNRCYIFIYRHDEHHLAVRLASKRAASVSKRSRVNSKTRFWIIS